MNTENIRYRLLTLLLRLALVLALSWSGWLVYSKLPRHGNTSAENNETETTVEIAIQADTKSAALDIPIELYPIDIVAVSHEYFTERRAGKQFDDFLKERMNGRKPITATLNKQGKTTLSVAPGDWWVHALLSNEEDLEWRLRVSVGGQRQSIELTPQNAYARTRSF